MKKFLTVLSILMIFIILGCQQPVGNSGDTYITNTINIVWQGSFENPPANPQIGWAYYNTSKRMSFVWDGEQWQVISQDGKSIVWKGELVSAPTNPEENWAYFNIIDGNSYIYNGTNWDYLAKAGRDGASGIMLWLGTLESAPTNPSNGYCYYNSTDKCSYIWDGDSWEIIAQDGTNGTDGASIIWKGVYNVAPSNPETNWAYYNTTSKTAYIWNGNSWNVLSESLGGDTTVQVPINWRGTYNAAPTNPAIGDAYYNSTSKTSYIYDGSVWQVMSKDGADGKDGTYSYEGTGYLITWKGSLTSAPKNPSKGWAYYNSKDGKSYIWDGSSWQIMAQDGANGSSGGTFEYTYLYVLCYTTEGQNIHYNTQTFSEANFGTVGLGSTAKTTTFYMMIQSSSSKTLKLTGTPPIQISGRDADCFSVVQPSVTEMKSGSYITDAAIMFTPTSLGEKTATITIPNNSPDYPEFSFEVKGIGAYWPKTFDGGEGDGNDAITCSAEDSEGNLYFVGYGFELVNNHSGFDWWIKKFDKDGVEDTINWNKKISLYDDYQSSYSPTYDYPKYIKIDSHDNVIIASAYNVIKFDSLGNEKFIKNYADGSCKSITVDQNDGLYVRTSNQIQKYDSNGISDFSLTDSKSSLRISNDNSLVIFNGSDFSTYDNSGTLKKTVTVSPIVKENVNIGNIKLKGYVPANSFASIEIPVVSGNSYSIYVYDDLDVKSSAYYKSNNTSIFSSVDTMSSTPKTFTASSTGIVVLKVEAYSAGRSGDFEYKIVSNETILGTLKLSIEILEIGFDNENNYYIGGRINNGVDDFSKKDVVLKKYNSAGQEITSGWNKIYDWGHCDDEIVKQIIFDGENIIAIGNGNDLINGASANDTWIKTFNKSGTNISSYEFDFGLGTIISVYGDKYYFTGGESSSYLGLYECNKAGQILRKIGIDSYGRSEISNPSFLISKKNGVAYIAGYGSNLITTKSGYDWQIIKY